MVMINSPMMQPPPEIKQTKVIINLFKTEYPLIEQVAKEVMNWRVTKNENPLSEFDVYWQDLGIDSDRLQTLKPYQKVNHFPAMFQITRKTFLARNLKRLQKLFPLEYDFFPKTWILPNEINDLRAYAQKPTAAQSQLPAKKKKGKKKTEKAEDKAKEKEKETDAIFSNQVEVKQEMILPRSSVRQAKRFSLQHAAPITPTKKDSAPPTSSSEEESGDETPVKATRKP